MKSIFKLSKYSIQAIKIISHKYSDLYIDGSLYNSASGLNFSCAGIKDDSLTIFFKKTEDYEPENFVIYNNYISTEGEGIKFPNNLKIHVDSDILADMNGCDSYNLIDFVVNDVNSDPPKIFALMR